MNTAEKFADWIFHVDGEGINNILNMLNDPSLISFGGGSPAKESFPVDFILDSIREGFGTDPFGICGYGQSSGYIPLREAYLEKMVRPAGISAEMENILITAGGTQGLDCTAQIFLNPGDVVFVENPTYLGAFPVFGRQKTRIISIETDADGIIPEDLEEKAKLYSPKLLYIIPTFQNPTGATLAADRRKRIAELASEYDFIVAEDDPYRNLRYRGEPLPTIKSYDTDGHVILLDSFSKIVSPGVRIGGVVAQRDIIEKMALVKQCGDMCSAILMQRVCADFLNRDMLKNHLAKTAPLYIERQQAMYDAVRGSFPEGTEVQLPDGGLFLWARLPAGYDTEKLLKQSVSEIHVGFVPGSPFFIDPEDGRRCLRLNYSSQSVETIEKCMNELGRLIKAAG